MATNECDVCGRAAATRVCGECARRPMPAILDRAGRVVYYAAVRGERLVWQRVRS